MPVYHDVATSDNLISSILPSTAANRLYESHGQRVSQLAAHASMRSGRLSRLITTAWISDSVVSPVAASPRDKASMSSAGLVAESLQVEGLAGSERRPCRLEYFDLSFLVPFLPTTSEPFRKISLQRLVRRGLTRAIGMLEIQEKCRADQPKT
jgi:hypothetical protein